MALLDASKPHLPNLAVDSSQESNCKDRSPYLEYSTNDQQLQGASSTGSDDHNSFDQTNVSKINDNTHQQACINGSNVHVLHDYQSVDHIVHNGVSHTNAASLSPAINDVESDAYADGRVNSQGANKHSSYGRNTRRYPHYDGPSRYESSDYSLPDVNSSSTSKENVGRDSKENVGRDSQYRNSLGSRVESENFREGRGEKCEGSTSPPRGSNAAQGRQGNTRGGKNYATNSFLKNNNKRTNNNKRGGSKSKVAVKSGPCRLPTQPQVLSVDVTDQNEFPMLGSSRRVAR